MPLRLRTLCCLFPFAIIVGCGSAASRPELVPVEGIVLRDGKAVAGALVEFYPREGQPSSGRTNESGEFELSYLGSDSGVKSGEVEVRITIDGNPNANAAGGDGGESPTTNVPEPKTFVHPEGVVVDGAAKKFEFELEKFTG